MPEPFIRKGNTGSEPEGKARSIGDQVTDVRNQLIESIAGELALDDRVDAVWLTGSLGRGGGDVLSDIDLIIVMARGCEADLVAERFEVADRFGPLVLYLDSPQNAPVSGAQVNALYDIYPLPIYVDWTLWPSMDESPSDVHILFHRESSRMLKSKRLAELPDAQSGNAPEPTPAWLDHFRVAMLPILAKLAARGLNESVYSMYQVIDEPAPVSVDLETVIASLDAILDRLKDTEPAAAIGCIARFLRMIPVAMAG